MLFTSSRFVYFFNNHYLEIKGLVKFSVQLPKSNFPVKNILGNWLLHQDFCVYVQLICTFCCPFLMYISTKISLRIGVISNIMKFPYTAVMLHHNENFKWNYTNIYPTMIPLLAFISIRGIFLKMFRTKIGLSTFTILYVMFWWTQKFWCHAQWFWCHAWLAVFSILYWTVLWERVVDYWSVVQIKNRL